MPDISPTAPQSGVMDELGADPIEQTPDSAIVAKQEDGTLITISPEGEVAELEPDKPEPIEVVPVGDVSDADDYKPAETDLMVSSLDDLPRAMDRADEVMILDELQGRALQAWVYSFESGGHLQTDLTVYGVKECVRVLNERGGARLGIAAEPRPMIDVEMVNGERFYRAMVFALERRFEVGHWGLAIEPYLMTLKGGGTKWDKFAQTKALNKAERNALKKGIPEELRQFILAQALGQGRVQELKPIGKVMPHDDRPVLTDERAEELKGEIRAAYSELKELNRLRIPPGQYNSMLFGAERDSHERLEETRDTIRSAIEAEQGARKKLEEGQGS